MIEINVLPLWHFSLKTKNKNGTKKTFNGSLTLTFSFFMAVFKKLAFYEDVLNDKSRRNYKLLR